MTLPADEELPEEPSFLDIILATTGAIDSKLARDVRDSAKVITREEAMSLVDIYYTNQEHRIALGNQTKAAIRGDRAHTITDHFSTQFATLERQMKSILEVFALDQPVGRWSMDQMGIGPILAAGLIAHVDITKAPTVGHIWSFAGLNPNAVWEKGMKRPYNLRLKTLCWKIGDSFVKVSGRDKDIYGHLYRERKAIEVRRDEAGDFAEQAAHTLATRNFKDVATKKIYESGHLPPGRLDLRARRWAVKIYLAHWHHVAYLAHYGELPPKPYVLEHVPGHVHEIKVPAGGDFGGS